MASAIPIDAQIFSKYLPSGVWGVVTAVAIIIGVKIYYDHINHPLYNIPGPWISAWSNILHSWNFHRGRQPYKIHELHEKYGPVVRTSPEELSFSSPQSWQDIYNFRPGHKPFIKSQFYDGGSFAGEEDTHSIVSERDPTAHGKMRKYLSNAFSDKSLKEQEYLVQNEVDFFIQQLQGFGKNPEGTDMVMWFNLLTFDIIGSLAFGESFNGLESGTYHPWIRLVCDALQQGALADSFTRFPMFASIFKALMPGAIQKLVEDTRTHEARTMGLVKKRVNKESERPDFLTKMMENRQEEGISDVQIGAHSSDFVTAGSETTATCMSAVTYYLLKTPHANKKVRDEIHNAFNSYDEINAVNASKLEYLRACCLEAMRMYSPLPFPLPRVVPEGGDTVDGIWLPAGTTVSTNPMAASMSSRNFTEPWEFKPERWIEQNDKDVLEATQPFSLGARGCLGRNLAWMELNTTLAKLHWMYDLELVAKDLDWNRESNMQTLWKKPPLMVRLTPRQAAQAA